MFIFDWDDTLQYKLSATGSISMFVETLLYPCKDKALVRSIIRDDDKMIITTRARLYTWAIKLKCLLITGSLKSLQDSKITTINPNFFFDETIKKPFSGDLQEHLKVIEDLKINLAKVHCRVLKREEKVFTYIDFDKKEG